MTKLLVLHDSGCGHVETLAGGDGSRQPSETALEIARFQGRRVAVIAARLSA